MPDDDIRATGNIVLNDQPVAFPNSAPASTNRDVDIPVPALRDPQGMYLITVTNPSSQTALTVIVKNRETLDGTQRFPELTRFQVPASTPDGVGVLVQGFTIGELSRISILNVTALNGSGAFTARVRVRHV